MKLSEIINNELSWFKEKIIKHKKNFFFYLWATLFFIYIYKIWFVYFIFIFTLNLNVIYLILSKNPRIYINSSRKRSIYWAFIKINTLRNLENSRFNKNIFVFFAINFLIRQILGFGYKYLRMVFSLFDCFYDEFNDSFLKKKKISLRIYKLFLHRSWEKFIEKEVVKYEPTILPEMSFKIRYLKIVIEVVIL